MHAVLPISVLILYAHPLLGLGLARLLASEPDLDVVALDESETNSIADELDEQPDVVIVERATTDRTADLLGLAPNAVVIDVGLDSGRASAHGRIDVAEPEGLVRAIRSARAGGSARSGGGAEHQPGTDLRSDGRTDMRTALRPGTALRSGSAPAAEGAGQPGRVHSLMPTTG